MIRILKNYQAWTWHNVYVYEYVVLSDIFLFVLCVSSNKCNVNYINVRLYLVYTFNFEYTGNCA